MKTIILLIDENYDFIDRSNLHPVDKRFTDRSVYKIVSFLQVLLIFFILNKVKRERNTGEKRMRRISIEYFTGFGSVHVH